MCRWPAPCTDDPPTPRPSLRRTERKRRRRWAARSSRSTICSSARPPPRQRRVRNAPAARPPRAAIRRRPAQTLPPDILARIEDHPCYNEDAHHYFARMHVAVAPACNIQCHYCNRKYDCANESRPGVVSERLSPERRRQEGAGRRRNGCRNCRSSASPDRATRSPITGTPSPPSAGLREELPDLKLCLSTNGLALPDHVDDDQRARHRSRHHHHQRHRPRNRRPHLRRGCSLSHRRLTGLEAATVLRDRQLRRPRRAGRGAACWSRSTRS